MVEGGEELAHARQIAVSALLGTSTLYHRVNWRPAARRWMRRLDRSMIYVLIAASYTPFALLALHGTLASVVLVVVWAGAGGGIALQLVWPDHPKWVAVVVSIALGWVAVATLTQLPAAIGWGAIGRTRGPACSATTRSSTPWCSPRPRSTTRSSRSSCCRWGEAG